MSNFANKIPNVPKFLEKSFALLERGPIFNGFVLVFAAALAIRLLFVLVWMSHFRVSFSGAEMGYVATNLYEGRGFSSPFSLGAQPTALVAPLVPFLWSVIMHLTSGPTDDTARAIIIIQTIPSALACGFYWLIARRVSSRFSRVPSGMVTMLAILFMVWPESLLRLMDTWYYVWQELGLAALVFYAMVWWDSPDLREGLIMGVVAGVVALANPTPVLLYAIALVAPLIIQRGKRLAIIRNILASGLVALLIVAPWIIRDAVVFGLLMPVRSNFPLELLQGNNPDGGVRQQATSLHPMLRKAELDRYERMGEAAYMQWAFGEAVQYMINNPAITVVRVVERIYMYWTTDIFDNWSWTPEIKWWNRGWRMGLLAVTTILSAVVPLVIVFFGIVSGRLQGLAYRFLFASLFILMPLPYYFTAASAEFSQSIRPWVAMLAVIAVLKRKDVEERPFASLQSPLARI
jgi:hypothetical protein